MFDKQKTQIKILSNHAFDPIKNLKIKKKN